MKSNAESLCEPEKGQDRHVVLRPFDPADVGPMAPSLESQLLLRPAPFFAGLAQVPAEPDERWVFWSLLGHPLKVRPGSVDIDIV